MQKAIDSPLFERVIESIIRSLRFGTSMAETLSNAGIEIRATRKTKLEEKGGQGPGEDAHPDRHAHLARDAHLHLGTDHSRTY